jgi:Holliday junction resolvasome RuvABC endonuclease subunit
MDVVVGVDPGARGAIAVVRESDGSLVCLFDATRMAGDVSAVLARRGRSELDEGGWSGKLAWVASRHDVTVVAVERIGAMVGVSSRSLVSLASSAALVRGAAYALGLDVVQYRPQQWQAAMLGEHGGDAKTAAVSAAKTLYPSVASSLSKSNGRADALLIAEHARRMLQRAQEDINTKEN